MTDSFFTFRSLTVIAVLCLIPAFAIAAPFDPEAATQAYLATLNGAARAKSDAYFEGGYWLLIWGAVVSVASDLILLRTGLSARFRDWAERVTKRRFLQSMLWTLPYLIAGTLLTFAWTLYTGYFREQQYSLLNQNLAGWLGDQAKGLGIGLIIAPLIVGLIMMGIRRSPRRWWLVGTGFAAVFIAFFVMIAPVFVSPMFNTYSELSPGPVRDRIVAMAKAKGVPADHIYVFNQSKQHKRISANVSGLGPTIRISLNDNLLNRTTLAETSAVMGHEIGHYVLGHVWKLVVALSLLYGFSFWLASRIVPGMIARWGGAWGLRGVDDVAAIPVYAIVFAVFSLLTTPLVNNLIRNNESEADAFGLDAAREPDGFAQTAMKLSEYRKISPGPIEEMLFFDHPSGATRIRMAMAWKAKNLPQTPVESTITP
jgi:STE24 endopeptidase